MVIDSVPTNVGGEDVVLGLLDDLLSLVTLSNGRAEKKRPQPSCIVSEAISADVPDVSTLPQPTEDADEGKGSKDEVDRTTELTPVTEAKLDRKPDVSESESGSSDSDSDASASDDSDSDDSSVAPTTNPVPSPEVEDEPNESKELSTPSKAQSNAAKILITHPDIAITSTCKLVKVGTISSVMEDMIIVTTVSMDDNPQEQSGTSIHSATLDTGSVLCLGDRKLLGAVFETFGPVSTPLYIVRFNNKLEIPSHATVGGDVFSVDREARFIQHQELRGKGYDASGKDDAELAVLDYSDDEKERLARRKKRAPEGHDMAQKRRRSRDDLGTQQRYQRTDDRFNRRGGMSRRRGRGRGSDWNEDHRRQYGRHDQRSAPMPNVPAPSYSPAIASYAQHTASPGHTPYPYAPYPAQMRADGQTFPPAFPPSAMPPVSMGTIPGRTMNPMPHQPLSAPMFPGHYMPAGMSPSYPPQGYPPMPPGVPPRAQPPPSIAPVGMVPYGHAGMAQGHWNAAGVASAPLQMGMGYQPPHVRSNSVMNHSAGRGMAGPGGMSVPGGMMPGGIHMNGNHGSYPYGPQQPRGAHPGNTNPHMNS